MHSKLQVALFSGDRSVSAGTFSGNWTVPDNVTISGAGIGTTVLKNVTGNSASVLILNNKSKAMNLTIDGYKSSVPVGASASGIYVDGKTSFVIEDVEIKNTNGEGVSIKNSSHYEMRRVYVHHTRAKGDPKDAGGTENSGKVGIQIMGSNDQFAIVDSCISTHNGMDGLWMAGHHITVTGGSYSYNGQGMTSVGAAGIYTSESIMNRYIVITGTTASFNTGLGIDIPLVQNIAIVGNITEHNNSAGIGVFEIEGGVIAGNVSKNNCSNELGQPSWQLAGVVIKDSENVSVSGNLVCDSRAEKTQEYGINFKGTVADSSIANNNIYGNKAYNFHFEADYMNVNTIIRE